jgi:hypothetical protein
MDNWATVVVSLIGSTIAGPAAATLLKFISDRKIERQKAQQSRELVEKQNAFLVGAASYMATVAFDKHIGFCEEYVQEMSKALHTLIQDGRTEKPLDARKFSRIRQKWALWLTHEIENALDQVYDANGDPVSNEGSVKTMIAYFEGSSTHRRAHRPEKRTGDPSIKETASRRLRLVKV